MIRRWIKSSSKPVGNYRIFQVRSDQAISPRTGLAHEVFVIECVDWVNVLAVTPDERLVMIEQYRHGTDSIELEIPGGMIDPHDLSPLDAGMRELSEETGYEGADPQVIGKIFPNPAIMSNTCYTVLVQNCRQAHELKWDAGEDLLTRLVPVSELNDLMRAGKIRHSLVAVALYHFDLWRRKT